MEKIELNVGGKTLTIERGDYARQADGAVLVRYGDTVVLVTACMQVSQRGDLGFFPLVCDYREGTWAAGKIPGGFFKREGKPTDKEVLTCRLIDRSIRPLFPEDLTQEVQIVAMPLSADPDNDPDILALIGASAALCSSRIPFAGPIAAVRVGMSAEGAFVVNPTISELEASPLNLTIAATEESVVMMEGSGREIPEEKFLEAVFFGFEKAREIVRAQKPWVAAAKAEVPSRVGADVSAAAGDFLAERLSAAYEYPGKAERAKFYASLKDEFVAGYPDERKAEAARGFERILEYRIRMMILENGKRLDGRGPTDLRDINCVIGLLPRTHGSAVFTRGQTQCLSTATLGSSGDEQIIDGLYAERKKRFMLHYNFPPFSVGEVMILRAPGRREIGHGALAERSIGWMLPAEVDFPYTLRIVANILESNGSSSMATVCASSLALMDAGVRIPKHVGGIALGLILEGDRHIILTDIAGEEDHYGDIDLKVAGTTEGITGFQMDVKNSRITYDILRQAIAQSGEARRRIIEKMTAAISEPRTTISPYAPRIVSIQIPPSKIGMVIGSGGKTIKAIVERTGAEIDIRDTGEVRIFAPDLAACENAAQEIKDLTAEASVGQVYNGVVTRLMKFGAFVKILPSQEGMVHISEIAHHRVERVEDMLKIGDEITVKVVAIDDMGRVNLSRKQAMSSEDAEKERKAGPPPSSRPPRSAQDRYDHRDRRSGPRGNR